MVILYRLHLRFLVKLNSLGDETPEPCFEYEVVAEESEKCLGFACTYAFRTHRLFPSAACFPLGPVSSTPPSWIVTLVVVHHTRHYKEPRLSSAVRGCGSEYVCRHVVRCRSGATSVVPLRWTTGHPCTIVPHGDSPFTAPHRYVRRAMSS